MQLDPQVQAYLDMLASPGTFWYPASGVLASHTKPYGTFHVLPWALVPQTFYRPCFPPSTAGQARRLLPGAVATAASRRTHYPIPAEPEFCRKGRSA